MRQVVTVVVGVVVVGFGLACLGGDGATRAEPDPAPEGAEPVTPTTPGTAEAPAGAPAEGASGVWKPTGKAVGHCTAGEQAVFSCGLEGGKVLSVCGGPDAENLQYRFGKPGSPELVFPEQPALTAFEAREEAYVRSSGTVLAFTNGDTEYHVASMSGSGCCSEEEAEMNNFVGVHVLQGGSVIASLGCGEITHDELHILREIPGLPNNVEH